MKIAVLVALGAATALTAAEARKAPRSGDSFAAVRVAVKAHLNDPDSAKIRNVRKTGPASYCGWVNAKNAYGGYAGDQLFYVDGGDVQIFDLPTTINPDYLDYLERQASHMATGPAPEHLSEPGKKVQPCLHDAVL